ALMILGFTCYYFVVLILRVRLELNERRIRALHLSGMFEDPETPASAKEQAYEAGHNAEAKQ
ncbi:MAG: heme transporter HemC, partial [Thalassospira sp.]|nr:heme transporter HemC [Thalassospira sp.]